LASGSERIANQLLKGSAGSRNRLHWWALVKAGFQISSPTPNVRSTYEVDDVTVFVAQNQAMRSRSPAQLSIIVAYPTQAYR